MCYIQVAYAAAALVGGYLASKAQPKPQAATPPPAAATPPAPTPVTPPKPTTPAPVQRTQQPLVQQARAANTGATTGQNASSASTMLTGPSGVDLSSLNIGRNTLLGM
jgi:hypothetical protein